MASKPKYLYHSSLVGGLEYLEPRPLRIFDGFNPGERGVWATDDIRLSRAHGISPLGLGVPRGGEFRLVGDKIILIEIKFSDVPKDLTAYTYCLDPRGFNRVDSWQFLSKKKTKVLAVRPYNLRAYLLKHFDIYETVLRKVPRR